MTNPTIPVIDLFAGPGGLGEGFNAVQDLNGRRVFDLRLSIEKDPFALQTLRLRAFFRSFEVVPDDYYEALAVEPGSQVAAIEQLFSRYALIRDEVQERVLAATLGRTRWQAVYDAIQTALGAGIDGRPWVLIGGPPCQAYSLVGRARMRGKVESPARARLHRLYRVYLRLVERFRPPVFVMENVKGLLSAKVAGRPIFQQILKHLQNPGAGKTRYVVQPFVVSRREPRPGLLFGENNGESVDHRSFVIKAEEFGVPQARHRVILLGVREDLYRQHRFGLPGLIEEPSQSGISDAIEDLPRLRSGLSRRGDERSDWRGLIASIPKRDWVGWLRRNDLASVADNVVNAVESMLHEELERRSNARGPSVPRLRPDWFVDPRLLSVCNHETRTHIPKDIERYLFAACFARTFSRSPKLRDFPPELYPQHSNVARALSDGTFSDRFRVQLARNSSNEPSPATTITSHIAKDGHYYIHYDPSQCRSLTVREAARLQTFPDNYFFVGPRTEQFKQVGNAVPPLLAHQLAQTVAQILSPGSKLGARPSADNVSSGPRFATAARKR